MNKCGSLGRIVNANEYTIGVLADIEVDVG